MVPYQQYPNLMGALLSMLADRNNETLRYPVIIVSTPDCQLLLFLLTWENLASSSVPLSSNSLDPGDSASLNKEPSAQLLPILYDMRRQECSAAYSKGYRT